MLVNELLCWLTNTIIQEWSWFPIYLKHVISKWTVVKFKFWASLQRNLSLPLFCNYKSFLFISDYKLWLYGTFHKPFYLFHKWELIICSNLYQGYIFFLSFLIYQNFAENCVSISGRCWQILWIMQMKITDIEIGKRCKSCIYKN